MNYFIFNNINSKDMGIRINKLPPRVFPMEKKELIEISGRDGYLTIKENAYMPITLIIECSTTKEANVNMVAKWLTGRGNLILSTEADKYYEAEIINEISITNVLLYYKTFIIEFRCQPYKKSLTLSVVNLNQGQNIINLESTGKTYPILEIEGTGEFEVSINDKNIYIDDIDSDIKVDMELQNATSIDGLINLNNKVNGEYNHLKQGQNIINFNVISGECITAKTKYKEAWI